MSDNEEIKCYDECCDVTPEQYIKILKWLYEHPEYDGRVDKRV